MCFWSNIQHYSTGLFWDVRGIDYTKRLPHGPIKATDPEYEKFLFIDWNKPTNETESEMAVLLSPVYRQTSSDCTLLFDYYIAGDINSSAIIVSFGDDYEHNPIDFLYVISTTTGEFKSREISLGRRVSDVSQVYINYSPFFQWNQIPRF